jgi:amino acid transporter
VSKLESVKAEPTAPASVFRSMKLVAWSFLGIRSRAGYQDDLAKVNPMHVVLVGIVGALLIVGGLISLVNWVVAK